MPSIQDIAKKTKNKVFSQVSARDIDDVFQVTPVETVVAQPIVHESSVKKKEFKKVSYRPWDDDVLGKIEEEGVGVKEVSIPVPTEELTASVTHVMNATKPNALDEKTTLAKIFFSLYGVQRNILRFLINNISHEDEVHVYTFPINLKNVIIFTSSSKNTVETSIRRMKEKKLIESCDHKRGRGGYVTFRIPVNLRDTLLEQVNRPVQLVL